MYNTHIVRMYKYIIYMYTCIHVYTYRCLCKAPVAQLSEEKQIKKTLGRVHTHTHTQHAHV